VRRARRDLARAPDLAARRTIEQADWRRRGPDDVPRTALTVTCGPRASPGRRHLVFPRRYRATTFTSNLREMSGPGSNGGRANAMRLTCGTCSFRIAETSWPSG